MSKLAQVQNYRYASQAGGLLSFIPKAIGSIGKILSGGILSGQSKTAQVTAAPAVPAAKSSAAVNALLGGGSFGVKRRSKGITGRELRGFRKVAKLLHKEGMVSKKSRGR